MILLGIDTSSHRGSVALVQNDSILFELNVDPPKSFSQRIFDAIRLALRETGIRLTDVDAVAATVGPGSFTGLRVGFSAALGFELGLSKPLVGIKTLDAYARVFPVTDRTVCPVLDARKNEIYMAQYRYRDGDLKKLMEDRVMSPDALGDFLAGPVVLYGDAVDRYGTAWAHSFGERVSFLDSPLSTVAAQAGILGGNRIRSGGVDRPESIELCYVRKPEAEIRMASQHPTTSMVWKEGL